MSQQYIAPFHNADSLRSFKEASFHQKSAVFWLTGLSGSGKSTLAYLVDQMLTNEGKYSIVLDGDDLRSGVNADLGFSLGDRTTNIQRASHIAKILLNNGLIVIASFVSPNITLREAAKQIIGSDNFYEVFIDSDIETCIKRDPKGFYQKALQGEIKDYTGIANEYEKPENPDLIIQTHISDISKSSTQLYQFIHSKIALQ